MKRKHSRLRGGGFPAPQPRRLDSTDVASVLDERRSSNRAGFYFMGAAAFFVLLAIGCFVLKYRIGIELALLAGWFCVAFALAWWVTANAHRIPIFARWTDRMRHLPERFRPSSLLAAILWFFIFHGGGIMLIRQFAL